MNNFEKRVYAIKELYPEVTQNTPTEAFDENSNIVEVDETAIANKIAEMDTARDADAQAKADLKLVLKLNLLLEKNLPKKKQTYL
jgi:hypothetical protein